MLRLVRKVKTLKAALQELKRLAKFLGAVVGPGAESQVDWGPPIRITYQRKLKLRNKVYDLAHELGHVLADRTYPSDLQEKFESPASGSIWELEDEFRAWEGADMLLEQLNPKFVSNEGYLQRKHGRLKTYYRYRVN